MSVSSSPLTDFHPWRWHVCKSCLSCREANEFAQENAKNAKQAAKEQEDKDEQAVKGGILCNIKAGYDAGRCNAAFHRIVKKSAQALVAIHKEKVSE